MTNKKEIWAFLSNTPAMVKDALGDKAKPIQSALSGLGVKRHINTIYREGETSLDVQRFNFFGRHCLFMAAYYFGNPQGFEYLDACWDSFKNILRGRAIIEEKLLKQIVNIRASLAEIEGMAT